MTFSFSKCVCLFPEIFLSGQCHFSLYAHTVGVHDTVEHTMPVNVSYLQEKSIYLIQWLLSHSVYNASKQPIIPSNTTLSLS